MLEGSKEENSKSIDFFDPPPKNNIFIGFLVRIFQLLAGITLGLLVNILLNPNSQPLLTYLAIAMGISMSTMFFYLVEVFSFHAFSSKKSAAYHWMFLSICLIYIVVELAVHYDVITTFKRQEAEILGNPISHYYSVMTYRGFIIIVLIMYSWLNGQDQAKRQIAAINHKSQLYQAPK